MARVAFVRLPEQIWFADGLAKLFVYSMSLDGPIREDLEAMKQGQHFSPQPTGYLAGSKALDYLDKLITSTETYFHPSNQGFWSLIVRFIAFQPQVARANPLPAHNVLASSHCRILETMAGGTRSNLQDPRRSLWAITIHLLMLTTACRLAVSRLTCATPS